MSNVPATVSNTSSSLSVIDCWNKIGVHGDASCPKLEKHIHCRNCPVYAAAAVQLLDRDLPSDFLDEWTRHIAQAKPATESTPQSVVVFRIGAEWLGLQTNSLKEIVSIRPVHSLPHRRNGVVLGLANVRGELLVCISLSEILRLDETSEPKKDKTRALSPRMLFVQHQGLRAVCPVDEVFGVHRFDPRELMTVPATLAKATTTYTKAVLSWRRETVGLLDEDLLFYTMSRGLA